MNKNELALWCSTVASAFPWFKLYLPQGIWSNLMKPCVFQRLCGPGVLPPPPKLSLVLEICSKLIEIEVT